jgi:hypothetical protein
VDVYAERPQSLIEQELDLPITLGGALRATKGYGAAEVGESLTRARAL